MNGETMSGAAPSGRVTSGAAPSGRVTSGRVRSGRVRSGRVSGEWGNDMRMSEEMAVRRWLTSLREEPRPEFVADVLDRTGVRRDCYDRYVRVEEAPFPVFVAFGAYGVSAVAPADGSAGDAVAFERAHRLRIRRPVVPTDDPPAELLASLRSGHAQRLSFDLRGLTDFEREVLAKAAEIPRGEVRPYAWVAREIGRPRAVRAVGSALGRNPVPVLIPCHRVTRSDHTIGQYAFGAAAKRALLHHEGVDLVALERFTRTGTQFVADGTTRVFCLPTCAQTRHVTNAHRVSFRNTSAALAAGYRPCQRCRPADAQPESTAPAKLG